MHIACLNGHLEIVYYFINEGFPVNAKDRTLKTPLHYACMNASSIEMVKILLDNGAKLDLVESTGKNSLQIAVGSDNPDLVQYIIK